MHREMVEPGENVLMRQTLHSASMTHIPIDLACMEQTWTDDHFPEKKFPGGLVCWEIQVV